MTETSYVNIGLEYTGDPFVFWKILIAMKEQAEKDGIKFDCGNITTISEGT
jgi:hypothetical protein